MVKTNSGLVAYVKAKLGCFYWFGTFGQMASKKLFEEKKKQYPKQYTAKDFAKQIANPKQVFDCAGLIKAYLWTKDINDVHPVYNSKQDYGATAFFNNAKIKGNISSFPKTAGLLVFKGTDRTKTHVGVYVGNGKVIEAKGHAYGVVETVFSKGGWKYWAQCNLISADQATEPAPAPSAPAKSYAGTYKVTAEHGLNLRISAGTDNKVNKIILCMKKNAEVTCDGEFKMINGTAWLKIKFGNKTGWSSSKYLMKI